MHASNGTAAARHQGRNRPGHKEAIIALYLAVGALEKAKASCEEDPDAYPEWPNAAWDAEGMIFTCEIYAELLDCHTFSHRPTLRRMVEQLKAIGFAIPERLVEKSKPLAPPRTGRRAAGSSRRLEPSMA